MAEVECDDDIVSDIITQEDSDNSNNSRYHITTNSTVIPVLICHTGYTSPTIVHSLENNSRNKDRYDRKLLGAIDKRESENKVVWITLQALQFKWNKLTIPKFKVDGTDLMSKFYVNTNHRFFFKT